MLRQQIQDQIKQAMIEKNQVRLAALRFVWAEIRNKEIDLKRDMTTEEVVQLIRKEVKNRREAMDQFKSAGRDDLVSEEAEKTEILTALLPKEMSANEIKEKVELVQLGLEGEAKRDFSQVMPRVMASVKGQADGSLVSQIVREMLNS